MPLELLSSFERIERDGAIYYYTAVPNSQSVEVRAHFLRCFVSMAFCITCVPSIIPTYEFSLVLILHLLADQPSGDKTVLQARPGLPWGAVSGQGKMNGFLSGRHTPAG